MTELSKTILEIRTVLYGNGETEPNSEACSQLTAEFFKEDTFRLLINCLPKLNLGVSISHLKVKMACKIDKFFCAFFFQLCSCLENQHLI